MCLIFILNCAHRQKRTIKHEGNFHISFDYLIDAYMDHDVMIERTLSCREALKRFFQFLLRKGFLGDQYTERISADPAEYAVLWDMFTEEGSDTL